MLQVTMGVIIGIVASVVVLATMARIELKTNKEIK